MTYVLVATRNWDASTAVVTMVDAEADGRDLPVTPGPPDGCQVKAGVSKLVVTVRSVPAEWWGAVIVLSVAADGSVTLKDRGDAVAVDIQNMITAFAQGAKVVVHLSRVKVVTEQIAAATMRLPPEIQTPPGADKVFANFIAANNADRTRADDVLSGPHSPVVGMDVQLPPLSPLHTIDPTNPVSAGLLQFRSGALAPANKTFVVEVAGNSIVPRTIAVSWPDAVPRGQPAPIYVYFRHAPRQESDMVVAKYNTSLDPYPYSFDYAFFCLLTSLWYSARPDLLPFSQGAAYQIEASGKKVVTVVACPTAIPNNKSTQFGDWTNPAFMQSILLEIQALAAALGNKPIPTTLGRVALGAFSSGHVYLTDLLRNGKGSALLTDVVKECYLFDPDEKLLPDLMPHLLDWEKNVPGGEAVIRLYNRRPMPAQQKPLIDPLPSKTPYIVHSSVGNRTILVAQGVDWDRALAKLHDAPSPAPWRWPFDHFAISAFMLTHAIANSGF